MRQSRGNIFGHDLPLGLVLPVVNVTLRGCGRIKSYGQVSGLLLFDDLQQSLCKDEQRGCIYPAGGENRAINEGKVPSINQRHPVEQEELFFHAAKLLFSVALPKFFSNVRAETGLPKHWP